jgi:hypothetical protein
VQSIGIQPLKYIPISKNSLDQIGVALPLLATPQESVQGHFHSAEVDMSFS